MNEQEFYEQFYEELKPLAEGQGISLKQITTYKNNQAMEGIRLKLEAEPIAPVIYPENYRAEGAGGMSAKDAAQAAFSDVLNATRQIGTELHLDWEHAKTHLRSAVIGRENNQGMLKTIPHEPVEDMALYARWNLGNGISAAITEGMLSKLQMTKEEALDTAKRNSRSQTILKPLSEVIADQMWEEGMDEGTIEDMMAMQPDFSMYFFSTKDCTQGAALAADPEALKQAYEELGEAFYILPCSVHETILLPKSECPRGSEELKEMVMDINRSTVAPEDRLTDSVYEFDGCKLTLAGGPEMGRDMDMAETRSHRHSR